jgi:hypothetical protein
MALHIAQPANITNLFGNWLNGVVKKDKIHIGCVHFVMGYLKYLK